MWDLFWQSSWTPMDRPGPLAWTPNLDGPGLTGSHLHLPDDSSADGQARRDRHDH